jgi:UDP-2-acetamido-3-amino-2,3-dideoxy-glucuronate N-acetyltransferase
MTRHSAHPSALVESENVGDGTTIRAFCHVFPKAIIGQNCDIGAQCVVGDGVVIGDRVTIEAGVQLWEGQRIEHDVHIGSNAAFARDPFSRNRGQPHEARSTTVRQGASVGANATILPGLTVGREAVVGAGAVVTRSVPPHAVVVGNPARIIRYTTGAKTGPETVSPGPRRVSELVKSIVEGVTVARVPMVKDLRGNLSARQIEAGIPFLPKRYFVVVDVPSKEVRGEHAHRTCEQLLTCLRGSVNVVVDDGTNREEFVLDSPELALYLPPMIWGIQYKYSSDASLLVLASERYDADDYIRDYEQFLREKGLASSRG